MDPISTHNGPRIGPYGALVGPEVSVEQTVIADSPTPTFMTKTNEEVPYVKPTDEKGLIPMTNVR